MTARQRSASSLSHNTTTSDASSPGGYSISGTGTYRNETDPLILSAAEIPSFHGDLLPQNSYGDSSPYPTMTATYIPSGIPPTAISGMSRPRAHTSSGPDGGQGCGGFGGLQQPRSTVQRNSMLPVHTGAGMRHVSTSQLETSGRFGGGGGGGGGGQNGGNHFGTMSVPPPPPMPPPNSSGLPAHALNQREYQPHYAPRPEYRAAPPAANSANYPYSPQPPSSSHPASGMYSNRPPPPPLQVPHQYPQNHQHYNHARPQLDMYRNQSAQSSESSFLRLESSSESDFTNSMAGNRGPQSAGATGSGFSRAGHVQSPLATSSSASFPITQDVANLWTLDRVISYLDRHHFPIEWHQAFKNLDIHGIQFLELAQNQGLFTHILPEVMRICPNADETKERLAAKNIKKMIREILRLAAYTSDDNYDLHSAPVGRQQGRRPMSATRSCTMPAMTDPGFNSFSSEHFPGNGNGESQHRLTGSDSASRGRNEFSRAALNSVDSIRHSPSNSESSSRDQAGGHGRPSLPTSPHGSPSLGFQVPSRHGHSNSTESVNLNYREGKNDKKALHVLGLLPSRTNPDKAESPHGSGRHDSFDHQQKHGGGKILEKVRKKLWPRDGENNDGGSPTSPGIRHTIASLPFTAGESNGSSSSIDRVSVSSIDGGRGQRSSYGQMTTKNKSTYILVTRNGKVWILVDITHVETAAAVRVEICSSLEINDWPTAAIHLTEVGQKLHGKNNFSILGIWNPIPCACAHWCD
jgi:hypothetical protein